MRKFCTSAALGFLLLLLLRAPSSAQSAPPRPGSDGAQVAGIADGLQSALQSLQSAVAQFDPSQLHTNGAEKQALAASQGSLSRNLTEAVPGLVAQFRAEPANLGAAFRLYRDLEAVLAVTQRTADTAPARDQSADAIQALHSSAASLRIHLDQLGNWIEARANADYARLQRQRASANRPAPPPPRTLIINNANAPEKPPTRHKSH